MIAIDIPMPKTCCDCPFAEMEFGLTRCKFLSHYITYTDEKHRPPECPLLEVEHVRDKTELSLWDFAQAKDSKSKEELDKAVKKFHASRLGAFILDHPELIKIDYTDDYDAYLRYYATDCYVVKINKEEKQ